MEEKLAQTMAAASSVQPFRPARATVRLYAEIWQQMEAGPTQAMTLYLKTALVKSDQTTLAELLDRLMSSDARAGQAVPGPAAHGGHGVPYLPLEPDSVLPNQNEPRLVLPDRNAYDGTSRRRMQAVTRAPSTE